MPRQQAPRVGTTIFTVMSRLAAETGAINLGQGFPDFDPPARLRELVALHLAAGHNQYAPMAGLPALCEAIAESAAAPARLACRSRHRDHHHGWRYRGDICRHPRGRPRGRRGDPARPELRLLRARCGTCWCAREARAACRSPISASTTTGSRMRSRHADAAARRQHAAQSGGRRAVDLPTGSGLRISSSRRDAYRPVGRGLRVACLRRPPSRRRSVQSAAARARVRRLFLRQDLQRDRVEGRLLHRGARAHCRSSARCTSS